jgi:hypothetical protein
MHMFCFRDEWRGDPMIFADTECHHGWLLPDVLLWRGEFRQHVGGRERSGAERLLAKAAWRAN